MCDTRRPPVSPVARALLPLLVLALAAGGCRARGEAGTAAGEAPRLEEDTLVVLTRYAPTTYYLDRAGRPAGFEVDLVTAFAEESGLTVRFEVLDTIGDILTALAENRGHLAAAGLTRTPARSRRFPEGPAYQTIRELAVCAPEANVRRLEDLEGLSIEVIASSSYLETLGRLRRQSLPGLRFEAVADGSTEQLLARVARGEIDCTVADSNIVAVDRRFLPELRTPFALDAEESLVWYFSDRGAALAELAAQWLDRFEASGELRAAENRYYGHVGRFDRYDTAVFLRRVGVRLPRWRPLFEEAAERTGLPWTLLAAVSYQESHWDQAAESPTGVRGLMMLTLDTAEHLGIEDRDDPKSSVLGGSRYLRDLIQRIPPFVPQPDRLWMALAAYNVGYEHLVDARLLAVMLDRNPNSWSDVKEVLPLLSQRRHYRRLEHGYARGSEPVIYVEQVRNYFDVLGQLDEEGGRAADAAEAVAGSVGGL